LDFIGRIPSANEAEDENPVDRASTVARHQAPKAAVASGTLALPPGPLGLLTIIPDLTAIWRIQAQMVADIAAIFGKTSSLSQEQMLYCLFRHAGAQVFRDVIVRAGERLLVRRASLRVLQGIARKIGVRLTQRLIGKTMARWVPVAGAIGVAGYAFFDTMQVAKTAIEVFQTHIEIEEQTEAPSMATTPAE
jgi:hypothetical protein